jgi:Cation efflux family
MDVIRYARRHADDERFSFGTGKLGDLAGFSSAIILAMIAIFIGYEAVRRFIWPVMIDFNEVIPIAALGLIVNVASVLLLGGGGGHDHDHGHSHAHPDHEHQHDQTHTLETSVGPLTIEIFEEGVPPRFRLSSVGRTLSAADVTVEMVRPDGTRQAFAMTPRAGYLEGIGEIPEPRAFTARILLGPSAESHEVEFAEHGRF